MNAESAAGLVGGSDSHYMQLALLQARNAQAAGEVPVGAVLVCDDRIIAHGANRPIASCDPTAHAEIEALRTGARVMGNYRLTGSVLYVTLEPCLMCAAALIQARVRRLVFGAWDAQAGACGSVLDLPREPRLAHGLDVFGGVCSDEAAGLLRQFFASRR